MKNKLLNFLTSMPSSGFSSKVDENGLQSPKRSKTTVFGILTICLLLCGVQDAFAQPANDACADAIAITVDAGDCADGVTNGDNTGATTDPEVGSCFTPADGTTNGVWFSFVAPSTGFVDVTTDFLGGTSTDTEVAVFDGCGGAQVGCDQDGGVNEGFNSLITQLAVTSGATFFVQVSGWNATEGSFCLAVNAADPPPPPPSNDLCADAIPLAIGSENACNFSVATNVSATDSGELPAPSCASYAGGDVWFSITVPAEITATDTITVDLGNAGGFTDSGMSIYSGSCGALTEVECDDDDSADGLFSLISLTGLTPGDVLFVRAWEFGNNAFGDFNICATTNAMLSTVAACNGEVDYPDTQGCNMTGATAVTLDPTTCTIAPEIDNGDGTLTLAGFDIYSPDQATGQFLGTLFESATFGLSACDPMTIGLPDNLGCNALVFQFEIVTSINVVDAATGAFVSFVDDPECTSEIVTFTQFPVLTAVDVTADAGACGTLQIDLVAEDGTVCDSQTQTCVADGDVLTADFSAGVMDPEGCSTLTATSAACAGCTVMPPACEADAPEIEADMGDCAADDGDGLATPFIFMASAGSTENTTGTFITEYIVLDGPGGNIVSVHLTLLEAQDAANALAAADGASACIAPINHDSAEFMTLSGELIGCVLGAPLPQANLTSLLALVGAAAPDAVFTAADILALIANGEGGTVDLSALNGGVALDCDISTFCFEIGAEVCVTNVSCDAAGTCAIAGDLATAPAAPGVTNSTCMTGGGGTGGTAEVYSCATGGLTITEVLIDPNGNTFNFDTDLDGSADTDDEFIMFCNTGASTLDIGGVILSDNGVGDWFTFPAGTTMDPGACLTVVNNFNGTPPAGVLDAARPNNSGVINNGGDDIIVIDAAGSACATVTVGNDNDGCVLNLADGTDANCGDPATYVFSTPGTPPTGGGMDTVGGGSFSAITCPAGSTAEYTTDGGASWSTTLPTYNQTMAMTVAARCLCDEDGTTASPASAAVTTVPGACDDDMQCPIIPAPTVENITICQGDPDGALTAVSATCDACEDGSDAMVTWWDHPVAQTGSGSLPVATGTTIDASGIIDANLPGMKFLYAQCECGECTSARTQLMIIINPTPSIDIDNVTDPTCFDAADGSYSVSAHSGTAPYTYSFDPPAGTMTEIIAGQQFQVDGLAGGTYNITVTDANGCTDSGSLTITDAPAFDLTVDSAIDETCFGEGDGSITVSSANTGGLNLEYGISPDFVWQPSGTFSGLVTGMYTVVVRDANSVNCTVSETILIGGPGEIVPPTVENYTVCVGEFIPAGEGLSVFCAQTLAAEANTTSVAIPDADLTNPGCSDVTFALPAGATIDEVTIDLAISHTWVGDLTATLTAPDGSEFILFEQQGVPGSLFGCAEDDLSLSFSDTAPNTADDFENACPAIVGGAYMPVDALSALVGADPSGTWSLCVTDAVGGDTGAIDLFNVNILFNDPSSNAITNIFTPAGALVATSSPFDPIAAGLVNNNIVGTHCFLASCSDGVCESPTVEVCLEITDAPAPIDVVGDASVCPGSSATFTAMGDEASSYIWSVSGAGNVVQSQDGNTAEILFGATTDGPFTVSVSETTATNCTTTSTTEVIVENVSQLACRSNLNVSLGADCGADLDASLFIKNAAYGPESYSIVSAINADGIDVIATGEGFTANETYSVNVMHNCSGTQCWSTMFAEDKIAPTISCPPTIQLGCTDDNRPTDFPEAMDNCCNEEDLIITFEDSNVLPAGTLLADGFNGLLATGSWNLSATLGTANIDESELVLTTDDDDTDNGVASASISLAFEGEVCFDYDFTVEDIPNFDFFFVVTNSAGEVFSASEDDAGSLCVDIATDDILDFQLMTDGFFPGEASEVTISNITYTNSEELVDNSTCGDQFLLRTWSVTDCNGNVGESCDQVVLIERPALADIEFPDDITLECGDGVGTDPADLDGLISDLDDEDDGFDEDYPVLEGEDLDEKTCFYVASYTDQVIDDLCGNTLKVIRTWTVTDWCTADQVQDIQIIKVEDTTAPQILNCGGEPIAIPAAAGACEGFYPIPMPEIFEACSGPVTVTANGLNVGDEVFIPEGGTTLTYIVTDDCGNVSTCDVTLTLTDTFGPVAICDANTTVSLSTFDDGLAVICYPTFDDGSFDNCEDDIVIKVKRMDSDDNFSNCVEFGCSDGGDTINIRMRVYDIYLDDFAVAQDAATEYPDLDPDRRFSECMIRVEVQDKLDPTEISCSNREIQCVQDYNDISDLGEGASSFPSLSSDPADGIPVFCTNCPGISEDEVLGYRSTSVLSVIDVCPSDNYTITITDNPQLGCGGVGRVFRSWRLLDNGEQIDNCTQQIRVENDFHIWEPSADGSAGIGDDMDDLINWPEDEVFDCNSGTSQQDVDALLAIMPNVADLVEGLEDDCASLFLSVNDQIVTDLPDACFAVIREWKIFDDCRFDANNPDDGGFWTATSQVTIIDSTAPTFDECGDREFDVTAPNCVEVDQVGCSGFADLSVNATDFCGDAAITYRWFLDANADGLVDQIGEGNDASGDYPIGTHSIRYEAEDGCGNVSTCEFEFKITDNKAPTPVCLVLTSTVMPSTGAIEIWATDFESGSSCDNCTAFDNLEWRINKGTNRTTPPNTTNVTFDCTEEIISFGSPMDVQVWVIDEAGNADFCLTQIVFTPIAADDTDHPCFEGPMMLDIAGVVETEDHEMVEMVNVDVSSATTNPFTTGNNGLFNFFGVPAGGNYVVTPEKDLNPLNGVSTFDLVLISQHILGVQPLDSPYKIIAADANLSGTVTTLDLVKIRSVILNIDSDFTPNTSWRFVDMDFVFPDATNPFATTFPEVIAYNNLTNDELATDFVGVKIGDVNGSALPNQLIGSQTRNIDGTLIFTADDIKLTAGNEYIIDFTANDFTELLGYQYSIEFDNDVLEFVNINTGELNELNDANFGYRMLEEGIITTSWNSAKATTMKDDAVLFSLTFNAKKDGQLSNLLSATSKAVKAEAYTTDLDLLDVAIAFNTENGTITSGESFELLQNVPNPFRTETVIGFNLEVASSATLQIMDVSGRVLKYIEGDFVRGYNEVKLNKQEFQGAGVLHYQLDTPTNTATKKMILID